MHIYLGHVLDVELQRQTLAEFWSTIDHPDDQQLCIQLAKETQLPVEQTATVRHGCAALTTAFAANCHLYPVVVIACLLTNAVAA